MSSRFYYLFQYLFERFQLQYLLLMIVLSALALQKISSITYLQVLFVVVYTICSYWIVRVYDEFRDLEIDKKIYPERPISTGKLKLRDLTYLVIVLLGACGFLAYYQNLLTGFVIGTACLILYLVIPLEKLRHNFVIYNLSASVSSLIIILSTYLIVGINLAPAVAHLCFTVPHILLLELTRKINRPLKDNYLGHLNRHVFFGVTLTLLLASLALLPLALIWLIVAMVAFGLFWSFVFYQKIKSINRLAFINYILIIILYFTLWS